MSLRLPSTKITIDDIMGFCKKRSQRPTADEAAQWMREQRRVIEGMMRDVIEDNLEAILDEACLRAYPDPAFQSLWRSVDNALTEAAESYATHLGREFYGSTHTERDMIGVVRRMLSSPNRFSACISYSLEFGKTVGKYEDRVITNTTPRAHLYCLDGTVSAEIIATDNCSHEHDVFTPEKLSVLQ